MRRSKGDEEDQLQLQLQLHNQFHHLHQDWISYKKSIPRRRSHRHRHRRSSSTISSTPDFLKLLHNSPKKLISSLQENQTPSTRSSTAMLTGDSSVDDIITARKAAIKSGKFKGRRLLEDLEGVRDEEICSLCSSVLIQGAEIDSLCSCCSSSVDGYGENYNIGYISSSSSSSSSSSKLSLKSVKKEEVKVGERRESGHGGKRAMGMGCFAIALVILAFVLISYLEFGMEEHVEYMIPT